MNDQTSPPDLLDFGRLRRPTADRHIAGVGAGIARHFNIDPIIVRVTLVVLVFFGGAGLLLYAAGWILLPEEGSPHQPLGLDDRNRNVALIGVGVLAAICAVGDWAGAFWFPWPVVLIAAGVVWLLHRNKQAGRQQPPQPVYPQPANPQPAYPQPPYPAYQPAYAPAPVRNPRKNGPILFLFTLALIATGLGTLGIIDVSGTDVPGAAYPALGLALTGVVLLWGAFWGRAGGLIFLGLVLAFGTLGAAAADRADSDTVTYVPVSAAEVRDTYDVGAGEVLLDLSEVRDVGELDGRSVTADIGVGTLDVVVPEGVDVTIEASTGAGEIDMLGRLQSGLGLTERAFVDGASGDAPSLTLTIDMGLGEIAVREQ